MNLDAILSRESHPCYVPGALVKGADGKYRDCGNHIRCEHGKLKSQCPWCNPRGWYKQKFLRDLHRRSRSGRTTEIECELTESQVLWLIKQPCFYCGMAESGGIDRRVRGRGYLLDNVVPCCSVCNMVKGNLNDEQFINRCKNIALFNADTQQRERRLREIQAGLLLQAGETGVVIDEAIHRDSPRSQHVDAGVSWCRQGRLQFEY